MPEGCAAVAPEPPGSERRAAGRLGGVLTIARDRTVDEVRETRGALDAFIEHELEPRRMPQPQAPSELPAEKTRGVREALPYLRGGMERRERREEHARTPHVRSDAHRGHGDVADARILHLARDQRREHALDLGLDALRAPACHRDYCSVLATSTRAKHSIWSLARTSW